MLKNACVVSLQKDTRELCYLKQRETGVSESQNFADLGIWNTCNINIIYDIRSVRYEFYPLFQCKKVRSVVTRSVSLGSLSSMQEWAIAVEKALRIICISWPFWTLSTYLPAFRHIDSLWPKYVSNSLPHIKENCSTYDERQELETWKTSYSVQMRKSQKRFPVSAIDLLINKANWRE